MEYSLIEKDKLATFCNFVSKSLRVCDAELEISSLEIGDQIAEDWTRFEGISYDPYGDVLHIQTPALEHNIFHPEQIVVGEFGLVVRTIAVKDAEGQLLVMRFREPLLIQS